MKFLSKILMLFVAILAISTTGVYAINCGEWSYDAINSAVSTGIFTDGTTIDYYAPINRLELAELISNAYENVTGNMVNYLPVNFSDTDDLSAIAASSLNIMNGYGDGAFSPYAYTTRQEVAKIILAYKSEVTGSPLVLPEVFNCSFTDFDELSEWAKPYVEKANDDGLLSGYVDGSFGGHNTVSWQEAIVLIERVAPFKVLPNQGSLFNLTTSISDDVLSIKWNKLYSTQPHTLTITEQRLSQYEGDIPPNNPIVLKLQYETSYSLNVNPNKEYSISLSCGDISTTKCIYTMSKYFDDMQEIYMSYPTTKEDADALMIDVTVPVWKFSGSNKVPSEVTFKVHHRIADKVKLIFNEIFNGPEKFPIKDICGYAWRGGTSEHNGGTAIDINSNENYCIYNNGTTIGSYWKPYEDPYSITPYGDVIRAFEKYGFTWGGDSWSNPKDYMHFSYLGT